MNQNNTTCFAKWMAKLSVMTVVAAAAVMPFAHAEEESVKREVAAYIGPSTTESSVDTIDAYQGVKRPSTVLVPKSLVSLAEQVGSSFRVEQRENVLFATDLDIKNHTLLLDGIFACCESCLRHDYFAKGIVKPLTVYVFASKSSYQTGLKNFFDMEPVSPYGHYGHSQKYIVVNYETGPGTLVHELTHAMMAGDFPGAPIWISEGMASLFEQCRVEGDSLKGDPNWRLPELKKALADSKVTPLKSLLALSSHAFRQKNESLHYAESRYFCKYLDERGKLRTVYSAFRNNFVTDPTGVHTIEKVMGKPIAQIQADWHLWLSQEQWNAGN